MTDRSRPVNAEAPPGATTVAERPRTEDPGPGDRPAPVRYLQVVLILLPVVLVLAGVWSYRWVTEDAFINFRVIGNLLAGHGPVYNVGERVEVYSDPLWLFTLAGIHKVIPQIDLEWLSVGLGLVCTGTGVLLAAVAVTRLGRSRGSTIVLPVGLVIFAVVPGVWEFATSGLEMGMVFLWIGLVFYLLVALESGGGNGVLCAVISGLGPLIRPEFGPHVRGGSRGGPVGRPPVTKAAHAPDVALRRRTHQRRDRTPDRL